MSSNKRQKTEEGEVVIVYKQGVIVPKNVTKVMFDASVTEIPDGRNTQGVFANCTNLKEVVLNEGLQKIGDYAFLGCTPLTVIKLPSTVIEIGEMAFYRCTNLMEVILNEGLQEIGNFAFWVCTSLTIVKFPSTVTEVGLHAFDRCTNLRDVIFNEGPQVIGKCAFRDCESLEFVKFPLISKRAKNLIGTGITEMEDKLTANQYLEWRGGEILGDHEAINEGHWETTRRNLDQLRAWISYYELREAAQIIELAMWKMNIEETGAVTVEERSACRGEVPGPAKEAIIQYFG